MIELVVGTGAGCVRLPPSSTAIVVAALLSLGAWRRWRAERAGRRREKG